MKVVGSVANGERPIGFFNNTGPIGHCMQQNCSGGVLEDADRAFSQAVLSMSTNGAKGEFLSFHITCNVECFAGIPAIVCSDGLDGNIIYACKIVGAVEGWIDETGGVVYPHVAVVECLFRGCAFIGRH